MDENSLNIGTTESGEPFSLPPDVLTRTVAVMAKKGAGKTYCAGVIMEEFAKQGLPFIVLDPVGVHWGIRAKANRKDEAYPVVVFGGEQADVPIDRGMGAAIADAILEEGISAILDLSELSKTAWREVVRDFCIRLYKQNRKFGPRHVFIEEATEFVPQTRRPELQEAFEAVERLVRMGRNRGIGVTLISQRSAQVAKDVLTQIDMLIALRTVGPQDRKALLGIFETVLEEDQLEDLKRFKRDIVRLPDGVAWVWSPEFLDTFVRVQIRERETYHAGATPVTAEVRVVQARPDVDAIRKRLEPKPVPKETKAGEAVPCNHEEEIGRLVAVADRLKENVTREHEEGLKYHHEAKALQEIRALLQIDSTSGGVGAPVDEAAIVERVLARIPQNGVAPVQVTPPEVLRQKYLQEAADRLYGKLSSVDGDQRRVLEYLLGLGKFEGVTTISKALTGQDGGAGFKQTQEAIRELRGLSLVQLGGSGGKQYKENVAAAVAAELAPHTPQEGELVAVTQNVLARLVVA